MSEEESALLNDQVDGFPSHVIEFYPQLGAVKLRGPKLKGIVQGLELCVGQDTTCLSCCSCSESCSTFHVLVGVALCWKCCEHPQEIDTRLVIQKGAVDRGATVGVT